MKYESIKQAAILMALDNGGINRYRPIVSYLNDLHAFLEKYDDDYLRPINEWLGTLSEADMKTFVSGEEHDIDRIAATGPDSADDLFNEIFEEVL